MDKQVTNLTDQQIEDDITPIWRLAFRPFFLFGAVFSIIAITLWLLFLSGYLQFSPYGGPFYWHPHEMLFGFVTAVIIGFLLTAVQTWTGLRAPHSGALIFIFSLWLAARILLATNLLPIPWLLMLIDVSLLPVCAGFFAVLVIKANSKRNLFLVPVLLILATANGLTHLGIIWQQPEYVAWGNNSAVMLIITLIAVVAGRVVPMFTANGTGTPRITPRPWLDNCVLISSWVILLLFFTRIIDFIPDFIVAGLFAIAAVAHAFRAVHWRPWVTLSTPLVWSMHIAYWFIPVGYGLFALHYGIDNITFSTALHALTAGAMSNMILAMMARISLGHSGRPLMIHSNIKYAFMLLIAAAFVRVATGIWPTFSGIAAYQLTGVLWVCAFALYVVHYSRILLTQRADGKSG